MTDHLKTLRDYVERSTHWREGGATRHDALKIALPALEAQKSLHDVHLVTLEEAIAHLHAVLNKTSTHAEQQAADTAARDWLTSIGASQSSFAE